MLIFDTERNGKSFDMIVKDLTTDTLMPVLLLNANDEVAFDGHHGFFYTQVDAEGVGKRVFRHQVGSHQSQDILIYEERSSEFNISVSNTNSQDFIKIDIRSTFKPNTNEVWLRNTGADNAKFWLV